MKKYTITAGAEQEMIGIGHWETETGHPKLVVLTFSEADLETICTVLQSTHGTHMVRRIVFDVHAEVDGLAVYAVSNGDRLNTGFNRLMALLYDTTVVFYYTGITKHNRVDIEVKLPGVLSRFDLSVDSLIEALNAEMVILPVPRLNISRELRDNILKAEDIIVRSNGVLSLTIPVPADCLVDTKPINIIVKQEFGRTKYKIVSNNEEWELDKLPE